MDPTGGRLPDGYEEVGTFTEKGWRFFAFVPKTSAAPQEWILRAVCGEEIREVKIPLGYEPRFGIDVADWTNLERETEKLLESLEECDG